MYDVVNLLGCAGGVLSPLVKEHQRPVHEDVRYMDPAEQLRSGGDGATFAPFCRHISRKLIKNVCSTTKIKNSRSRFNRFVVVKTRWKLSSANYNSLR